MQKKAPIVTIDGPAGSGKSTIAKAVAWRLSFAYLDTGALYRAVAVELRRRHLSPGDDEGLSKLFSETAISLVRDGTEQRVQVNGRDVTGELRSEAISLLASRISAKPAVRAFLIDIQRGCGRSGRLVAEGRDMGTVVFPEANIKFFLDASAEERARRRHKQLSEQGMDASLEHLVSEIAERDARDTRRAVAPLRPAAAAETLDTTPFSIAEVCDWALTLAVQRLDLPEFR